MSQDHSLLFKLGWDLPHRPVLNDFDDGTGSGDGTQADQSITGALTAHLTLDWRFKQYPLISIHWLGFVSTARI